MKENLEIAATPLGRRVKRIYGTTETCGYNKSSTRISEAIVRKEMPCLI